MEIKDAVINVEITLPVNPPGAPSVLSFDDVWAGLLHSQRYAQEYVPHVVDVEITSQTILSDTTASYKRICYLDAKLFPDAPLLLQDVTVIDGLKVVSYSHTNNTIATVTISVGAEENELYYSLSYERPAPGVKAGTEEARKLRDEFIALGRKNIALCLDLTRKYKDMGKYENPVVLFDGASASSN